MVWAGRRLLLDAATGLVYEEASPGGMVWAVGKLALGQVRIERSFGVEALDNHMTAVRSSEPSLT